MDIISFKSKAHVSQKHFLKYAENIKLTDLVANETLNNSLQDKATTRSITYKQPWSWGTTTKATPSNHPPKIKKMSRFAREGREDHSGGERKRDKGEKKGKKRKKGKTSCGRERG